MKKFFKLMVLITALTFCIGTTVFASETTYDSVEGDDVDMDGEGGEGDQSTNLEEEDNDLSTVVDGDEEESTAGGTASPQTNASIAPIVAMAGLAAAGAAAGLKRR